MTRSRHIRSLALSLAAAAAGLLAAGCSMIHPDMPDCPEGLEVQFVYDYNTQRADMFGAHVGDVRLMVFDSRGDFVKSVETFNNDEAQPLRDPNWRMRVDLPEGEYRLVALGHQRRYEQLLTEEGAKYRHQALREGHTIDDFMVRLDRLDGEVLHNGQPLDTVWHAVSGLVEVKASGEMTPVRMSLVRDTKQLTVSLHELDAPCRVDRNEYEVTIGCDNGTLGPDNSLLPDETLTYRPHMSWTTEWNPTRGETAELGSTARYAMTFNRIMHRTSGNPHEGQLKVVHRPSGTVVATMSLADILAQGRGAFETQNYSPQEYLDREYDYRLDMFLKGGKWEYTEITVSVLDWVKRIQHHVF